MELTAFELETLIERRRFERFTLLKDGGFSVSASNDNQLFGIIIDISLQGLAFIYKGNSGKLDSEKINIVTPVGGIRIAGLRYKNVCDFEIIGTYPAFNLKKRKRSIQFTDLSRGQMLRITDFIERECRK